MKSFNGMDWTRIAIANYAGHDKMLWEERLIWFYEHEHELEALAKKADKPYLYIGAVNAYRQAMLGVPTGFIMDLDACASGAQLMSLMCGSRETAINTNLISNGKRNDLYSTAVVEMNKHLSEKRQIKLGGRFTRSDVKKALMTALYGSKAEPRNLFGSGSKELEAFYKAVDVIAPGITDLMAEITSFWNPEAIEHSWVMPDGFVVKIPVTKVVDQRIELPVNGSYTYRGTVPMPSDKGISLIANTVQAAEAYLCRELIRKCDKDGFNIITVFDAFFCSPVHMQRMRENFLECLYEFSQINYVEHVGKQLLDDPNYTYTKMEDISEEILTAEYFIS